MAAKAKSKTSKRLYYKIGEACKLVDIQPYVLRYWETEFASLKPNKSRSGQRVYSEKELAVIRRIKALLYEEGYTIAGAKKKLETETAAGIEPPAVKKMPVSEARKEVKGKISVAGKPKAKKAAAPDPGSGKGEEKLRQGIENALGEARDILALLDSQASS